MLPGPNSRCDWIVRRVNQWVSMIAGVKVPKRGIVASHLFANSKIESIAIMPVVSISIIVVLLSSVRQLTIRREGLIGIVPVEMVPLASPLL